MLRMMGFPSQPNKRKEVEDGGGGEHPSSGSRCSFGVAAMQGWRPSMEDAHLAAPDFDVGRGLGLFGVFDGHGGSAVAKLVAEMLPGALKQQPAFRSGQFHEALTKTFLHLDTYLASPAGRKEVFRRAGDGLGSDDMGCTAVVALVRSAVQPEIYVANAGDSRCVLVSAGKAVDMSRDHAPTLPGERRRIKKAGGFVTGEGRVNGNLNLSRALGDLFYKQNKTLQPGEQLISGVPDVRHRLIDLDKDRFLILACDGIWERASSQAVANFLLAKVAESPEGVPPKFSSICGDFLDQNLSKHPLRTQGLGCDNMTLMLVDLLGGSKPVADIEPPVCSFGDALGTRLVAKRALSKAWMPPPRRRRLTLQLAMVMRS